MTTIEDMILEFQKTQAEIDEHLEELEALDERSTMLLDRINRVSKTTTGYDIKVTPNA